MLLRTVRNNIVQSIRAFTVNQLQDTAKELGQHFLYANLAMAQSKQDVLDLVSAQFSLPAHFGKNFDALYDCLTDQFTSQAHKLALLLCLNTFLRMSNLTKKHVSSCWTFSGMLLITGETGKYHSDVSILFSSPFCAK